MRTASWKVCGPRNEALRNGIVTLGAALELAQVSVKARSNDGLGPEGEGAACGAWATVLVYPLATG